LRGAAGGLALALTAGMQCQRCGAPITTETHAFCTHCGAQVGDLPRVTPTEYATHPERFARVAAHPDYPAAMAAVPPPQAASNAFLGVGSMLISFVWFGMAPAMRERDAILLFVGLGLFFLLGGIFVLKIGASARNAPLERLVAVVIGERSYVTSSEHSTTNHYMVTLQTPDGARREYKTTGELAAMVGGGDIGVAYLRADHLDEFRRFTL
jgi:hypothetical protein